MGTITLLKLAIARQDRSIEAFEGSTNPQTKVMYIEAKARKEALEACLQSLRGDNFSLKLYGNSL